MAQNGNNSIPGSAKLDPQPKDVRIAGVSYSPVAKSELPDDYCGEVEIKNAAGGPYGSGR